MGAGLALAAYAAADARGMRDHAPVRAFVFMALRARDDDSRPAFFAGRDALAGAMSAPRSASGYRSVERAVRTLADQGLIKTEAKGAPGRNTRYSLLDGTGNPLAINTRRSPSPVDGTPDTERPVSNSEHPTLSVQTPDAQRPEHPTLSVDLRKREEKEEERASAPARTCTRHSSWKDSGPCAACRNDRVSAEEFAAKRRPATMSERVIDCSPTPHRVLSDGTCMRCEQRGLSEAAA